MDGSLPTSLKHIISNAEYYGPSLFLLGEHIMGTCGCFFSLKLSLSKVKGIFIYCIMYWKQSCLFLSATEVVTVFVFQEPSLLSSLQDNGLTDVMLHALLIKDVSLAYQSPPPLLSYSASSFVP